MLTNYSFFFFEGSNRESVEQSEEDEELVEVDGLEVLAAAPEDVEKVDKSQILHLRQQLDADLHIATNIDELLEKGKVNSQLVGHRSYPISKDSQPFQLVWANIFL